jgi:hypothetical protein
MTSLLNSLQWNPFWDPWMPFLLALFHLFLIVPRSISNPNDYYIYIILFSATSILPMHPFINSTRCEIFFCYSFFPCTIVWTHTVVFFHHISCAIDDSFFFLFIIMYSHLHHIKDFLNFHLARNMNIWTCIPMMWTICISHKNNHFQVALHGIKIWTNKHIDCTLILIFNFSSNVGKWYFSPTSSYFIPLFDFLHHSLIVVKDFHWSILQYTTFEIFFPFILIISFSWEIFCIYF